MTATATQTKTPWHIKGYWLEFCNCNPGCTCNFGGFPTSPDGSCKAFCGIPITEGRCGDVDLSGVKAAAVIDWPGPIHEGGGKAVLVVDPATTDEQTNALAQICTGQLGGMPWEIFGATYEAVGIVKAPIGFKIDGRRSSMRIEGVGEAIGDTLKNPVTGDDNMVSIVLDHGFIWKKGECGQGSFKAAAEGVSLEFDDTNWIFGEVDWTNQA